MKLGFVPATLTGLLLSVALSCSNGGVTNPTENPNVLIYSSFEENGRPSLSEWFPDVATSHIGFSRDVPPRGGRWSLSIKNSFGPSARAVRRSVPAFPGKITYQLSFWAKGEGRPGYALVFEDKPGFQYVTPVNVAANGKWSKYSGSVIIQGDPGDSVLVYLSGRLESAAGTTYFDEVILEALPIP
jgi:hypothetical protein